MDDGGSNAGARGVASRLYEKLATGPVWVLAGLLIVALIASVIQAEGVERSILLTRTGSQNSRVVVFVHGFIGDFRTSWGKFPELILEDPQLKRFDVFLWGYPSRLFGKNPSIALLGDELRTELNERLRGYKQVYLIGHSLGGLVIKSMVIGELKTGRAANLERIKQIVLFGTPNEGRQVAALFRLVNRQLYDLYIGSDLVDDLRREWINRVYSPIIRAGDRNFKRQIPVTMVVGAGDEWVPEKSARSYYWEPVPVVVQGTHTAMKEPVDREALAYVVVRNRLVGGAAGGVQGTPAGKIGIWIARLGGDSTSQENQESLMARLEHEISKEMDLLASVEVRKFAEEVYGENEDEMHQVAREMGGNVNASLVVWGRISSLMDFPEFYPRVTVVRKERSLRAHARLDPVSKETIVAEKLRLDLPPERIREPVQVVRMLVGLSYYHHASKDQDSAEPFYERAARMFERVISAGEAKLLEMSNVNYYLGMTHFYLSYLRYQQDHLNRAIESFQKALAGRPKEAFPLDYAMIQQAVGNAYTGILGGNESENLAKAIEAFEESARIYRTLGSRKELATINNNLGYAYWKYAELSVKTETKDRMLAQALRAYGEAIEFYRKRDFPEQYATIKNNLGHVYWTNAQLSLNAERRNENLGNAMKSYKEALIVFTKKDFPRGFAATQVNLGNVFSVLESGDPKLNLSEVIKAYKSALSVFTKAGFPQDFARVEYALAGIYRRLPTGNRAKDLADAIKAYQEATTVWTKTEFPREYAAMMNNIGNTYTELPTGDVRADLTNAINAYEEAIQFIGYDPFSKYYGTVNNNLEKAREKLRELDRAR